MVTYCQTREIILSCIYFLYRFILESYLLHSRIIKTKQTSFPRDLLLFANQNYFYKPNINDFYLLFQIKPPD